MIPEDDDADDLGDLEGIEEVAEGLSNLTSQCKWTGGTTGLLELKLKLNDIAMISKATDGKIVINTFPCDAAATSTSLKKLQITEDSTSTGAQTVILDYMNGTFGMGTSTGIGTTVDLGSGTDALKIRGSKLADTYVFGKDGITINTDTIKDVTQSGVENYVATLSDGNDSFTGNGSAVTGTAFLSGVLVYGGAGNDTLRGGNGDDTIYGSDGNDTVNGGSASDGKDVLSGGADTDTVDYSARVNDLIISQDDVANDGEGEDEDGNATELDNVGSDFETLKSGAGDDKLTGTDNPNTISGGAGDDVIAGGKGVDVLNGEADDDTFDEGNIAAGNGGDTLNGGAGTDVVDYSARPAKVTVKLDNATADDGADSELDKVMQDVENVKGGDGDDIIVGSTSANVLDGGKGVDNITGGDGNDTLVGGEGADILTGGNGDDVFNEGDLTNGGDTMTGNAGVDQVDYSARDATLDVTMNGNPVSGEASVDEDENPVTEGDKIALDIENLRGGKKDDKLTGNPSDNLIEGGAGVDTINGLAGDDFVDGDAGDDKIDCGAGEADILLDASLDENFDTLAENHCEL